MVVVAFSEGWWIVRVAFCKVWSVAWVVFGEGWWIVAVACSKG